MAVKKIHWLVIINCVYLCILGWSTVAADAEEFSQHFVDQTIRMDGAISSVTPQTDGRYNLEINREVTFTCIPFTTSEPRMRTVSVMLQNRGRYLNGCECHLQWMPQTGQYQCFCFIQWTFRRAGEASVKCCIDDSYHDSCHHGYTFPINVWERTTTNKWTTHTIAESTDVPTFLSTMVSEEESTQLITISSISSSDTHSTSIPSFQTESSSSQTSKGFTLMHWLSAVGGVLGAGLIVIISARIWMKRTSQDGDMPTGTPV